VVLVGAVWVWYARSEREAKRAEAVATATAPGAATAAHAEGEAPVAAAATSDVHLMEAGTPVTAAAAAPAAAADSAAGAKLQPTAQANSSAAFDARAEEPGSALSPHMPAGGKAFAELEEGTPEAAEAVATERSPLRTAAAAPSGSGAVCRRSASADEVPSKAADVLEESAPVAAVSAGSSRVEAATPPAQ